MQLTLQMYMNCAFCRAKENKAMQDDNCFQNNVLVFTVTIKGLFFKDRFYENILDLVKLKMETNPAVKKKCPVTLKFTGSDVKKDSRHFNSL